jgi:hypothetical protein
VVPVTITTASTIKPTDNFEFFIRMFVRLLVSHPTMRTAFSKMIAQHVHGKATRPFFESQKAASNRHTRVQWSTRHANKWFRCRLKVVIF